jgi:N-acetylglucosamine-6-phosphate deacetylase
MSSVFIYDGELITPHESIPHAALWINENGKIEALGQAEQMASLPKETIRLRLAGKRVLPGLIDIHVHGGYGGNFGNGDLLSELQHYSKRVVQTGVTGFLLSIAAPSAEELLEMISAYVKIFETESMPGAQPIGLHLEGPFINSQKKGAFDPAWIRTPDVKEAQAYIEAGKGWIGQITIAPEMPQAADVAALFRQAGVVVAMGHTNADYETASAALDSGAFNHITHSFNAQRGFNHRVPGVFGAILSSDVPTAELIADNMHVHPAAMRILGRCLGPDRIVLITDAIAGAGLADGVYDLLGQKINIVDGRVTLDNGTLAGSTAPLIDCVQHAAEAMQIPYFQAVQMASLNPARVLGIADERGSLAVGKRGDVIAVDTNGKVCLSVVNGKIVYNTL